MLVCGGGRSRTSTGKNGASGDYRTSYGCSEDNLHVLVRVRVARTSIEHHRHSSTVGGWSLELASCRRSGEALEHVAAMSTRTVGRFGYSYKHGVNAPPITLKHCPRPTFTCTW
eukprot:scaffold286437_cov34-Prasinocladus_malaysianus.AAC.1